MRKDKALTARQERVLRWVAEGCPGGQWPDETHKTTARALSNRGLVQVTRRAKRWQASLTGAGRHYVEHGCFPPREDPSANVRDAEAAPAEPEAVDAAGRAMRHVESSKVRRSSDPAVLPSHPVRVQEVYMKYKVVVTRVQVAERFVRAPTEEEAAATVQAEFDRPYGYFGSWKTTASEVEVVEAQPTTIVGPAHLSEDGPLLLSVKDAAKALGIAPPMLYQMLNQGDVAHVVLGSRKFVSREALKEFIAENTHRGYYRAR